MRNQPILQNTVKKTSTNGRSTNVSMSKFHKIYLSKKTADIILIYQISYQLLYQIRGYAGFLFPGLRSS